MSTVRKSFLLLLGLLVLLIITAFAYRHAIVEKVVIKAVEGSSARIEKLDIQHIGVHAIEIKRLRATLAEQTRDMIVDVEDLRLEFGSWQDLPDSLQKISIRDGFLQIDAKSEQQSDSAVDSQKDEFTLQEWLPLVQSTNVHIDRLELVYSEDYKKLLFEMIGSLQKDSVQWVLSSKIGLFESFLGELDLSASADGAYQIVLTELQQSSPILQMDGQIRQEERGLLVAGQSDIQLGMLQQIANSALPNRVDWSVEDDTNIDFDLFIPFAPSNFNDQLSGTIKMASAGKAQSESVGDLQFDAEVECLLVSLFSQQCRFPANLHAQYSPVVNSNGKNKSIGEIDIELVSDETLKVTLDWEAVSADVTGGMKLNGSSKDPDSRFDVALKNIEAQFSSTEASVNGQYEIEAHLPSYEETIKVRQGQLGLNGEFQWRDQAIRLTANKGASLTAENFSMEDIAVNSADLRLQNRLIWRGDLDRWRTEPVEVFANFGKVVRQEKVIATPGSGEIALSNIVMSNGQMSVKANFHWNEVKLHAPKFTVPLQSFNGLVDLRGDQFLSKGEVHFGSNQDTISYETSMDMKSGAGAVQLNSPSLTFENNQALNRIIASTGYPLNLHYGGLSFSLRSRWEEQFAQMQNHIDISVHEAAGTYAQLPFRGFSTQAVFIGNEEWVLRDATRVVLEEAFVGVPVENIHVDVNSFSLQADNRIVFEVPQFMLNALGGSVIANQIRFDSHAEENRVLLKLSDLSLEELIKYQKTKDLFLSGHLLGELPIIYSQGVVTVDNGSLSADQAGGIIRYLNLEYLKSTKADLSVVSDMLKNFHYQTLSANASLSPEGDILLKTHLQGKNPDLDTAAVNLNFNIEFNLPSALKTAKLLYFIDKDIEAYIRSRAQH